MTIQAGVKIAVDQNSINNAEKQIIDFSKQMQNLLDNIKANIDVEASMRQLQELNNEIKIIKESLNSISSNSKPIIDTTQLQHQGDKAMQTIEQIKEQLSSMGEVQFKYTGYNEMTGQFDKIIAKVKEADGVVKQFNAERSGLIGDTPLYNLNQSSITDNTQIVANRQAIQEQNQQLQESLSLLKQEYNLESDINTAKQKNKQETLLELQAQQQLVQSKLAESATGLSNDNRSQLIQQATQYQNQLNTQITQQVDKETQVNTKLEQQVAQFKTLASIKIQNLESTGGDALKNSDIQSQINSLKQLKDTVNTTNFSEKQTEWNNSLKQTQANVREVNTNLKDQHSLLGNIVSDVGKFAEWTVAASSLMLFVNGIKDAITYVNQMDNATADLSKVVDMSTGQLNDMKDAAVSMGKELGQSSLSIMQGFAETARVLKNPDDIKQFTEMATMAANVTDLTVAQASKSLTTTMISYHQNVGQVKDDLDQLNEIKCGSPYTVMCM